MIGDLAMSNENGTRTKSVASEQASVHDQETQRLAEYNSLRNELLQNKQYVFERPLLIITATGIAAVQVSDKPSLILPVLLIIILWVNLRFTVNRLRSIARIVAYISVVLESAPERWTGWENALRTYRIWIKQHTKEEQRFLLAKHIDQDAIPDAMMFYEPIYLLHVSTVIGALVLSIPSLSDIRDVPEIVSFVFALAAAFLFLYYGLGSYHPKKMRNLIEVRRAIWIEVLNMADQIKNPGLIVESGYRDNLRSG
jgi:hypothetical protein